ncbi:hypothetical protein Pelo_17728 [Pelomyxa schiedti]|nr:hypothetical protein Pelo_17728 [Pelomyxa schiedti]
MMGIMHTTSSKCFGKCGNAREAESKLRNPKLCIIVQLDLFIAVWACICVLLSKEYVPNVLIAHGLTTKLPLAHWQVVPLSPPHSSTNLFQYREINPDVAISTTKLCTSHLKAGSALHCSNSSSAAYNVGSRQTLSRLLQFLVMKVGNHCRQNSLHSSYLPKLRFLKEKLQPAVIPTAAGVLLSQCRCQVRKYYVKPENFSFLTMKGDSWCFPPCSLQCLKQLCVVLMSSTTVVLSLARGGISSYLGVCHTTVSPDHDSDVFVLKQDKEETKCLF